MESNAADIARLSGISNVAVIEYSNTSSVQNGVLGSDLPAQLEKILWIRELISI